MPLGGLEGRMAALAAERARAMELGQIARGIGPQAEAGVAGAMQEYRAGTNENRVQTKFDQEQQDRAHNMRMEDLGLRLGEYLDANPGLQLEDRNARQVMEEARKAGVRKGRWSPSDAVYGGSVTGLREGEVDPASPGPALSPEEEALFIEGENKHTAPPVNWLADGGDRKDLAGDQIAGRQSLHGLANALLAQAKEKNPDRNYTFDEAMEVAQQHMAALEKSRADFVEAQQKEMDRQRELKTQDLADASTSAQTQATRTLTEARLEELNHGVGASARTFQDVTMPFVRDYMDGKRPEGPLDSHKKLQSERAKKLVDSLASEVGAEKSAGSYRPEDQNKILAALGGRIESNMSGFKNEGSASYFSRLMKKPDPKFKPTRPPKAERMPVPIHKLVESQRSQAQSIADTRKVIYTVEAKGIKTGNVRSIVQDLAAMFDIQHGDFAQMKGADTINFINALKQKSGSRASDLDLKTLAAALEGRKFRPEVLRRVLGSFSDSMSKDLSGKVETFGRDYPEYRTNAEYSVNDTLSPWGGLSYSFGLDHEKKLAKKKAESGKVIVVSIIVGGQRKTFRLDKGTKEQRVAAAMKMAEENPDTFVVYDN